jgi:hypothetical protein
MIKGMPTSTEQQFYILPQKGYKSLTPRFCHITGKSTQEQKIDEQKLELAHNKQHMRMSTHVQAQTGR